MIDENPAPMETSSTNEEPTEDLSESVEESLLATLQEAEAADVPIEEPEAPEAAEELPAEEEPEKEESSLTKAARELASAKKGRKGKVTVEASELDVPVKPTRQTKQQTAAAVEELKYEPPQRWDVASKEQFNQLPAVAKKQVLDFWNGIEGNTTKIWQDLNRKSGELGSSLDVIRRYEPDWHADGFTTSQMLAELAATRHVLKSDPIKGLSTLAAKMGITPQQLFDYQNQQNSGQIQPQQQFRQPQQNNFLTADQLPVILDQYSQRAQTQAQYQRDVEDVRTLLNEIGPNNRYVWPELHDSNTVERLKPLAQGVRETQPGISWKEATKQAIAWHRFQVNNGSPSSSGPRLSPQQEIQRARTASASIKGRGNVITPTAAEPKMDERVEDSFLAVMQGANSGY